MLYNGQLKINNYLEAVKEDVLNYINDNGIMVTTEYRDENDTLFTCDSVTGSYTFNAWKAEEYLCHNWDLLSEALTEFGCDMSYVETEDFGGYMCFESDNDYRVMIETLILLGCLYLSIRVTDYIEKQKQNNNN